MNELAPKRRPGLLARWRASFLTGLVVVLPIGLTIYLVWTFVGWLDGWILPIIPAAYQPEAWIKYYFGPEANFPVRGVGVIVFLVFTVFIGWIAKGIIGRSAILRAERLVDRMPVVRSVYNGIKQLAETVFSKSDRQFDRTCLVEFPRSGSWALGFVAPRPKGEIADRLPNGDALITVFVALTPFTSGMLLYVPAKDVVFLDMSLEDAAKLIVSGGLVYPNAKDVELQPAALDP